MSAIVSASNKRSLFFPVLVSFLFAWVAAAEELRLEALDSLPVTAVESPTFPKAELQRLQRQLSLSVGKPLDWRRLDEVIHGLAPEGGTGGSAPHLQTLFVDAVRDGKGVKIILRGVRVRTLRRLTYKDIEPSVLDEAKRKAKLEEGEKIDPRELDQLREAIAAGYAARGFPSAVVDVAVSEGDDGLADVTVSVNRRDPSRIRTITINGVAPELATTLRDRLALRRGDILTKRAVDESTETIQRYLKANQYPAARVDVAPTVYTTEKLLADVTFNVRLGERIQFLFEGNRVFDDFTLRSLLTEEVLSQTDAVDRIASLVEAKYRSVGFHFCRVKPAMATEEDRKLKLVRFRVDEGPKVIIDALLFNGGDDVGTTTLRTIFYAGAPEVVGRDIYWEPGVKDALTLMQRQLQSRGYLSAAVATPRAVFSPDRKGVELVIDIDLGPQTRLLSLDLKGNTHFSEEEIYKTLGFKAGDAVDKTKLDEARRAVVTRYQSEGYADAKLEDEEGEWLQVSKDGRQAVLRLHLAEGRRYKVGRVVIEGNRKTMDSVILREMKLTTGDTYDPEKVRQSEDDIGLLGLFSKVELVPATSTSDPGAKDLRVIVREVKPGVGELGFGGLYEDPRLRLRAFLGLAYRNLFGQNQTASIRSQISLPLSKDKLIPFIEHATVLGYRVPYPLGVPVTFNAQLGFDTFEVATAGPQLQKRIRIEGKIEKKFSPKLTGIYRLYRFEHTLTEDLSGAIPTKVESIGSTGPGVILDLRNDIFNPTKGSYHTFDIELASPVLLSGGNIAFVMALTRNSFFIPLINPFSMTVFVGAGYAHSLGSAALPTARLTTDLALGGQASIRGFSPRRFSPGSAVPTPHQTAFYNGRIEVSSYLFANLSAAVFFDTGEIFPDMRSGGRNDGVGIGFRYKTPVGPVVIDIAQGLGPNREVVKFYFTVGTL